MTPAHKDAEVLAKRMRQHGEAHNAFLRSRAVTRTRSRPSRPLVRWRLAQCGTLHGEAYFGFITTPGAEPTLRQPGGVGVAVRGDRPADRAGDARRDGAEVVREDPGTAGPAPTTLMSAGLRRRRARSRADPCMRSWWTPSRRTSRARARRRCSPPACERLPRMFPVSCAEPVTVPESRRNHAARERVPGLH